MTAPLALRRSVGFALIGLIAGVIVWNVSTRDPPPSGADAALTWRADNPPAQVVADRERAAREAQIAGIHALGSGAVTSGFATEYEVSGWHQTLDLTISSLLPGDARDLAAILCEGSGSRYAPWTLRVFILTSSDRPAATCLL